MSVSLDCRLVNETVVVVDVSGRSSILDGTLIQQTAQRLLQEGSRYLVFNLSNLIHMDSFGLGQLIATYLSVRDSGGDVKLVKPTATVRDLLKNTRLDTVLQIFDSEDEALQSIPQAHA